MLEVHFDLDSYRMSSRQKAKMDSVLDVFPIVVQRHVEIYGHTDSLAGLEYNRQLSKKRVQSILTYLVYQGLDPLKVKADFYGEERPKYDYSSESGAFNRRCEVYFTIETSMLPAPDLRLVDLEFKTGNRIRIPNLNFVGNQAIPMGSSFTVLEELLEVMNMYPDLIIELQGHVCCFGDQQLSEARAKMVYDFLVGNGISSRRMSYKGLSNTKPLYKENSDKEKALNRRVEVLVISNTDEKRAVEKESSSIDLRAPVMNVKFFPKKMRLTPSGDFMLTLIAEMINESSGLKFEFVIFDNINDAKLTGSRAKGLERALLDKMVRKEVFLVRTAVKTPSMPIAADDNYILLKISK